MNSASNFLYGSLFLLFATTVNAQIKPMIFQSKQERTSLLELFTSEGCSSCPPAERWLSTLKSSPGLWREFVPVAYHVDYWDHLGWRDPWASGEFSDRQRAYARSWQGDSIYTPGFVLNGQEWRDWSNRKEAPSASRAQAGVLKVSSADGEHWQVSFSPPGQAAGNYEVHAAMLASELNSDVKAGENRGHRLNHDFVVAALVTHSLKKDGDRLSGEFEFKPGKKGESKRPALAVWVTPSGGLEPLQAVGGWLSN
jgi:hypothetical protein